MSYSMKQRCAVFRILRKKYPNVLTALNAFFRENDAEYVNSDNVINACENNDIKKAFYYARWTISQDDEGICDITFNSSRLGSEEALFCAIAHLVETESYIEMEGEDKSIWRWIFDGKYCREENAKVIFSGQNPLLPPPCNIGDTVYMSVSTINNKRCPANKPIKAYVESIHYYSWGSILGLLVDTRKLSGVYQFSFNEYNKVYFSSEEDAAKAIEDLQEKEN